MKAYHDITGDGGSRILEQVAGQRARIAEGLARVRHLVAVGSGKGGVGKSTLALQLARALGSRGLRIAILDADFNGPSQARMAGVQRALFVPGRDKVALPRTASGIGVFSLGSLISESEALEFETVAHGESHTWRATREFALLGEVLGSFDWGALDLLIMDLPPGSDRTVQYADFLGPFDRTQGGPFGSAQGGPFDSAQGGLFDSAQGGPRLSFLLVTIPSEVARGVVSRSIAALARTPNRLLGYVENMSGYYCRDCNAIKPLFDSHWGASPRQPPLRAHSRGPHDPRSVRAGRAPGATDPSDLGIPCLGAVPFDPELARHCDLGIPLDGLGDSPVGRALDEIAQRLLDGLDQVKEPRP